MPLNYKSVFPFNFKALRIFVESVLRYGLPVNFRAAIVIPGRNQKKLRDKLNQIFESLDSAGGFNQAWGLICLLVKYIFYRINDHIENYKIIWL